MIHGGDNCENFIIIIINLSEGSLKADKNTPSVTMAPIRI